MTKKVYVMLSGGVDSSVAASVLLEQGYDVVGVHMQCWSELQIKRLGLDPKHYACTWEDDLNDAKLVAKKLGIEFKVWDFQKEYLERVVEYMINEYKIGRTPNPDVMCNSQIKFGIFFEKAMQEGADFVATGHYARKEGDTVLRGRDSNKDQTYFIWRVKKAQLNQTLFPVGEFTTKSEVRQYALDKGLITADKKDSQGLCFVGQTPLRELLKSKIGVKKGYTLQESETVSNDLKTEISRLVKDLKVFKKRIILTIDGPAGGGKSSLARLLESSLKDAVKIEWDDFYKPVKDIASDNHLENYDSKRLFDQVIKPFLEGQKEIEYERYNWAAWGGNPANDQLIKDRSFKNKKILILEGLKSTQILEDVSDLKIWCDVDIDFAKKRGVDRDLNDYGLQPTDKFFEEWDKWTENTKDYISQYNPQAKADIVIDSTNKKYKIQQTIPGQILGTHPGAHLYTIGQRSDLGLSGGPWFVSRIDVENNLVYVVTKENEAKLLVDDIKISDVNWLVDDIQSFEGKTIQAQIRYRQQAVDCVFGIQGQSLKVKFTSPVKAAAIGQSCVFYDGGLLLGGGVIS